MSDNAPSNTTRLYFQNINGLQWDNQGGKWPYICEVMEGIQADIVCLTEINTDTSQYKVRQSMESACRRQFHQSRLVMATSKYTSKTTFKPGGTAVLARNAITARIKSHTRDRMGRWATISLATSPTTKVRIISAYQVCADPRQGTNTAASQQRAQLLEEQALDQHNHRLTPRRAFIQDLQAFIQQVQHDGETIILVGDFNEDIADPASGMAQLATACGLTDLFGLRLGTNTSPATYQRGHRRIDYVLISPTLMQHVKAAGYDPFGYRLPTDHRGLFIDFESTALFSQELNPLAPADRRDFISTAPGVVPNYIAAKTKYLEEHNFFERLESLNNLSQSDHRLAESLDRDFQRASRYAAHQCARRKQTPWSPKLAEAWAELHYYRLARSAILIPANVQQAITKLQKQWVHLPQIIPTDLDVIQQGYNTAVAKLRQVRQQAKILREEYLDKQVALYKALEEQGKAKIVRRIIRAETQHRVYNKIRYLRNQDTGTMGLSSIKIPRNIPVTNTSAIKLLPDTPEHWETITVPGEIEQILLQRNSHHFGQAEGTPFTQPPLKAAVGYNADGYAVDMILTGQFNPPSISDATRLLIQHLQSRTTTTIQDQLTKEEVLGKLKTWKEATTTSPSGLHLGHYHCLWRDPKITHDEEAQHQTINNQEKLLQCLVDMLNYAVRFGYTYKRWTKIINVMLQKDPGNPRVHRLRIIHIYEADYNMFLAIKWRQALYHAEDNQLLNEGLYGSRPGKTAHDPVLIEVLQHEIYRMSMKSGVNFDLDATSCYDRILTSLASICSQRVGVPHQVTQVNTKTLELAQYHLKTSLGISHQHYQHSAVSPIHGTGQGSGNSPTVWCFVCSTLFDAYASKAHGATFTNYAKTSSLTLHMVGFVDDCAQRINRFDDDDQPTAQTLRTIMQKDAQLWNDLLWASGGTLEQQKCSFHLVQTSWNRDGHPFLTGGAAQHQPIWISHDQSNTATAQKSNYTAHKTLGCWINPAHCHTQAWKNIQKKNEEMTQLLEANYFTRIEAWTFYTAIYIPSITYPLPLTPLTKPQCQLLDARLHQALAPRCGYNRHMATAIRYAPHSMGGAGFRQLYMEQGALLLQIIYKYLNSPSTQVGKMLAMAISWTQAFLGTSTLFLTTVDHKLPPVGPSILLDLRQFLQSINGCLVTQDSFVAPPLRQRDRYIMDIALQQKKWQPRHLSQINACRRYLQAQTISDLTNSAGTRLTPQSIHGNEAPASNSLRCSKFNQVRPGEQAWRTWRKFLLLISDKHGVLTTPLGRWIVSHTQTRRWSTYVYEPQTDRLFTHVENSQYRELIRFTPGTFTTDHHEHLTQAIGYPTTVLKVAGTIRPQKNYVEIRPAPNAPVVIINDPFRCLPPWERQLLQHHHMYVTLQEIRSHVQEGNIVLCSDGSATRQCGTFGFIVATKEGIRLAKCHGPAPGAYPNSFRSEGFGVLAAMRWLYRITTTSQMQENTAVTHYLDNQSVIRRIKKASRSTQDYPNHRLQSEQDVIDEIKHTLQLINCRVQFKWVKGHQDSAASIHNLSLQAQLNCEADREAARYRFPADYNYHQNIPLPHTPCQLIIQHKSITSKIKYRVHESATIPRLLSYLETKFRWGPTVVHNIDWENFTSILTKYRANWTTIVKHIHNISPTGRIAHRNDPHVPHECPVCNLPQESNTHVLQCPHHSRKTWRDTTIAKVSNHESTTSDPYLVDILQDGLMRFHRAIDPIPLNQYPPRYHQLISTQNDIGWDQLYKGRWSLLWGHAQDNFKQQNTSDTAIRIPGQTWVLSFGRLLIDQWLILWKLRNEERHGKDIDMQNQIRTHKIKSELQELYSYKDRVCPSDRNPFHATVEDHLERHSSLDSIEDWIAMYREAIKASVTQAMTLGITRNGRILDYPMFNPIDRSGQAPERQCFPRLL